MLTFNQLLAELKYNQSPHYHHTLNNLEPETAHLFRVAFDKKDIGINGIYVFQSSTPLKNKVLSAKPAVCVTTIKDTDHLEPIESKIKKIRRSLWNLSCAPFIIIHLPNQIRVYAGFNYNEQNDNVGLIGTATTITAAKLQKLHNLLADFTASAIDTGQIWKSKHAKQLNSTHRVNEHLLNSLKQLGTLLKKDGLDAKVAHALIGKYVFLNYLYQRGILIDDWLNKHQINPSHIFSHQATKAYLHTLINALSLFNGKIFPIDFNHPTLKDSHISWVASIFSGDKFVETAPEKVRQLHLPFKAYDFKYIPVETLSAIYEQFLADEDKTARKNKGAVYTPEFLADYLLSEINAIQPLKRGMKIFDPACGSGIFLVLAYRRLIEIEMQHLGRNLSSKELRNILLESIYGVEREADACYVAEFSLILTLLHYSEPRQLQNLNFELPDLHNNRIFNCDFFDLEGQDSPVNFWQKALKFDWIVGNPPWIELKPTTTGETHARTWLANKHNQATYPTAGKRVAEAFSWLITQCLKPTGISGLLLPATSLFNLESKKYRQAFFSKHTIYRITNFANFRDVLFGKKNSGVLPTATIIYQPTDPTHPKPDIIHYAPFIATQNTAKANDQPWSITINQSEIQIISPQEAEKGETSLWKLALWGTHKDKRAIERLRYLFPNTLTEFCEAKGWGKKLPQQGPEIRKNAINTLDKLEYRPELKMKRFNTIHYNKQKPNLRYSIATGVLEDNDKLYLRIRGGEKGLRINSAPHIIISKAWQNFTIYSDQDFIIPPQQLAITAPKTPKENTTYLQALTVYLSSSLVAYYLFFHVPEWGVFRQRKSVVTSEVRKIPTPNLTLKQASELATLHKQLVETEKKESIRLISEINTNNSQKQLNIFNSPPTFNPNSLTLPPNLNTQQKQTLNQALTALRTKLQAKIDQTIFTLFQIPTDIRLLVEDFIQTRLPLDKPTAIQSLIQPPSPQALLTYAKILRNSLDDFAMGMAHHRVSITYASTLIECVIEMDMTAKEPFPIPENSIKKANLTINNLMAELSSDLRTQFSQWTYVQQGLCLFEDTKIYLYKQPRLIDWTRTQALNDANNIIGTTLSNN